MTKHAGMMMVAVVVGGVLLAVLAYYIARFMKGTMKYDFKIAAPNMQSPEFMNSTVGQALTVAFSLLGNSSARLQWKIEARLDAQGVDLATSQAITINSNQLL